MSLVNLVVGQFVVESGKTKAFQFLLANFRAISGTSISLNTFEHLVEGAEVGGVEGELGVDVGSEGDGAGLLSLGEKVEGDGANLAALLRVNSLDELLLLFAQHVDFNFKIL